MPLPTDTFFPPEDIDVPRGARELDLVQLEKSYAETGLPVYLTEIHKKFSIPFACFVFGVLGLGLGIRNRREGRSWGFVASLGVIFFYYVLIDIGESMAVNGRISPMLGMWAANMVLGAAAIVLLVRAARETSIGLPSFAALWQPLASRLRGGKLPAAPTQPAMSAGARRRPPRPVVVFRVPRFGLRFPNTLDRYVAREFFRYFVLILSALVVVYLLGLLIDVISDAFQYRVKGILVVQYLAAEQPQILFHMLPLSTLMATLVNFAIFTKTSELTAAKAGGVSLYRLSVPVILVGALVSGGCFALQEYLLPYANRRAAELRDEIKKRPVESYNVLDRRWMMGQGDQIYNYAYYDPNARRFSGLALYRFSSQPFGLSERLYAREATWEPETSAWRFHQGWRRNFREGAKVERFDDLLVHEMEPPSYFVKQEKRSDQMTYLELSQYVDDLKRADSTSSPWKWPARRSSRFL